MRRSTVMMAGAATVALAASALSASPAFADPIPVAASYADLLEPVPNAMERLAVADANQPAAHLELAQWGGRNYHHHHHHHHHHDRRWYQSNGYYWNGGQWLFRPVYHHHHHDRYDRYDRYHHHHHHHHHDGY